MTSSDDMDLLNRVKEICRSYRGQAEFTPEVIVFDLQEKYPEYRIKNRGRLRDLLLSVQVALRHLDRHPHHPVDADRDSNESEVTVIAETTDAKSSETRRKRKAERSVVKNAEVIELEENEKIKELTTTNLRKNSNLINKQQRVHYAEVIVNSPASQHSSSKNKQGGRNSGSGGPSMSSAKRGLGSIQIEAKPRNSNVRFSDLGGCERQLLEVCRLAMHIRRPKTYALLGVEPPKGFLVHGPPGCGKTLFAQAVAGEFQIPMLQLAATELVSGVSGETEQKIRQLFETAKQNSPCVLILDDVDSIAPRRETASREMERRVVNQLCNSLDDLFCCSSPEIEFDSSGEPFFSDRPLPKFGHVLVIGTTSRPDALDNGLRRAGRFDCEIALGIPDEEARYKILRTLIMKDNYRLPLDQSCCLKKIARLTPGYVGADLSALVRETAKCAVNRIFDSVTERKKKKHMSTKEIEEELEKELNWLKADDDPSALSDNEFQVCINDFERAIENVQPSAKREGFATVPDVSWNDIGALSNVRQELEWNILYPVKRPEDFAVLGISLRPRGILLCGPPGCGKTLLAKAVANETGMNFISVKGPELLNMYVGESERAVRTVFQRARDSSPCVIFFDEIDALCPKRSGNETSGSARLVNQLLTEMDGIEGRRQVFLIGATNRPDIVDAAILRPGRLDKILFVDFPSASDRVDILKKSTKNGTKPQLADDVDLAFIASSSQLDGYTGADLAALVHEASIIALKERLLDNDTSVKAVSVRHFNEAMNRVRPSVSEADRKRYDRMREIYSVKT